MEVVYKKLLEHLESIQLIPIITTADINIDKQLLLLKLSLTSGQIHWKIMITKTS